LAASGELYGAKGGNYYGSTTDGWIHGYDLVYLTARSTADGYDTLSTVSYIGIIPDAPFYAPSRTFLEFDTSGIDDSETVTQANLYLTIAAGCDLSEVDFDVRVHKCVWTSPISAGNMDANYNAALASTYDNLWRNTSGLSEETSYASSNLDVTWVSKTGITQYALLSDHDLSLTPPVEWVTEFVGVYNQECGTASKRPYLSITATTIVNATVTAVMALANAESILPSLAASSTVLSTVASASTTGIVPQLQVDSTLVGTIAQAVAAGIISTVRADSTIVAVIAEAIAESVIAGLRADSTITAAIAEAEAEALASEDGLPAVAMSTILTQKIDATIRSQINSLMPDWFRTRRIGKRSEPKPVLWLRPDSITELADGDHVELWEDKSGNGLDAEMSYEEGQPLYKATIANGEPVVRFDTYSKSLVCPSDARLNPIDNLTIFAVAAIAGVGESQGAMFGKGAGPDNKPNYGFSFRLIDEVPNAWVDTRTNETEDTLIMPVSIEFDEFYVWTIKYRPVPTGIEVCLRQNGVEVGSEIVPGDHFYGGGLGSFSMGNIGFYAGLLHDLAELRIYNVIVHDEEVINIENELKSRYIP
jgi:hypothetical protein